jgi:hypothetical protein
MNTIHRVIRRRETKMLIKEVDQYGTYINIGEYNLPGRVIGINNKIEIRGVLRCLGLSEDWWGTGQK